jgi:hypothetical protein
MSDEPSMLEETDIQKMVTPLENCSTYFLAELIVSVFFSCPQRNLLKPIEMVQIRHGREELVSTSHPT